MRARLLPRRRRLLRAACAAHCPSSSARTRQASTGTSPSTPSPTRATCAAYATWGRRARRGGATCSTCAARDCGSRLRTLYVWIRELYADEQRLPFMLVSEWFASEAEAREQERCLITQLAERGLPLLNAEAERLRQTRPRTAATPAPGR